MRSSTAYFFVGFIICTQKLAKSEAKYCINKALRAWVISALNNIFKRENEALWLYSYAYILIGQIYLFF